VLIYEGVDQYYSEYNRRVLIPVEVKGFEHSPIPKKKCILSALFASDYGNSV
jgi:hypothetical protein